MALTHKNIQKIKDILKRLLLVLFVIGILFPIYWIFLVSVIPSKNLLSQDLSWLIPREISLQYYKELLATTNFGKYYLNSLVIASITTILTLIVATLGGYSLARLHYPGRNLLGRLILFTYIVPPVLLLIPLFQIITQFHMQNKFIGLIIAYMTFSLPFCLWMLRGFFLSLPASIEEAALIDGASVFGAFYRVVLPLAAPGLVASAMFTFMLCWNEFLFALVFINNDDLKTVPVGVVTRFITTTMVPSDWSKVMAASIMSAIPVYLLFIFLQRFLIQGLAAGSVKE